MSLSRRLLLCLPFAVAACGFTPVYGPGGTGSILQNRVTIAEPAEANTFLLVRRMEERLGRSEAPQYGLSLTLATREEELGIDPDSNVDRFNLIGTAGYVLSDLETGTELGSGTVNSFTGYSATGSPVVTLAAARDARERLMTILADQIVARLLTADIAS